MSTSNQETSDSPPKQERQSWHIWLIGLAAFLFVIAASWYFPDFVQNHYGYAGTDAGTFGDQYGALNTFFSGLAFAGLVIAILLQREDLKLQREEMREARAEAAKQTKEAAAQTALMAEQTLSACMFSYLETMQKHKASIHIRPKHATLVESSTIPEKEGDDAINFIYDQLDSLIENLADLNNLVETAIRETHTIDSCNEYLENIAHIQQFLYSLQLTMGYFRSWVTPFTLWNKRVYQSQMTDEKKREYVSLMFDSLTDAERFTILTYSIIARTSLYRNGNDTPPDPSILGKLWLGRSSKPNTYLTAYYEGGMALLYHLLERKIYGREALVQRITAFYERQLEDILREAPVSAEDTPS